MKFRAIIVLVVIAAVLGVTLYAVTRPKPTSPPETIPYIWDFEEIYDLKHITLEMPRLGLSESFVQQDDKQFYFDVENGSIVDTKRWGGGIPLLLSGPRADRVLVKNATDALLAEYGFTSPNLLINLLLKDETIYNIELGNATPSGKTYYVRLAGLRDIYTVDSTWYDVITRLVTEPPYPPASFICENLTLNPLEGTVNQPVSITAEMVNTGAVTGQFNVELKVNGVVEATKTIELARNQRTMVTFTISKATPGTYSISIAGKTAKLVIK